MKCKSLTEKERLYAERNSNMIDDFLALHNCNDDDYGTVAIAFIRAVKFCFRFSSFTNEQFTQVALLFMQEALEKTFSPLEIVNLDSIIKESYCMEENTITNQTVAIAAEHFMKVKLVAYLLQTAEPAEKRIMELIYAGVPNDQILNEQNISQETLDSVITNIRSRISYAA